jgi:putative molybdopterin biosynthesis protein
LNTTKINGYQREESSHLAVATAVSSGNADCGLGIQAAAQGQRLDFVPLFDERYDLAIPKAYFDGPLLAPLLDLLRRPSSDFLQRVDALGGYGTAVMGQVIAEVAAVEGRTDSLTR